jgi:AraC-like DNA-binding protein
VHALTGRVLPLADAFGVAGARRERAVLACDDADPGPHGAACEPAGARDEPGVEAGGGFDRWPDAPVADACLMARLEAFVRARLAAVRPDPGRPDPHEAPAALVAALVGRIARDRTLTTVEAVARAGGVSTRTLQRLFRDYVGVSAKWVLCRQRLHEAAAQLAAGAPGAWTRLALDLGYYDQAHFVRSFTALVGVSPGAYVGRLAEARAPRQAAPARPA